MDLSAFGAANAVWLVCHSTVALPISYSCWFGEHVSRLEGVRMSVAAFKAALSDRDPQVRKAVREVPDGTYTAVQLDRKSVV